MSKQPKLVLVDYSVIEARILAAYLGAPPHPRDPYTEKAATMFGVPVAQVTREQRAAAKHRYYQEIHGIVKIDSALLP